MDSRSNVVFFIVNKRGGDTTAVFPFVQIAVKLHRMQRKGEGDTDEDEEISEYWMVEDMFTFENIGFSNTVDNMKYLICADCEMGPVGWHDLNEKKSYIALSRVKHA